jgi:carboxylesterase
MPAVTLGLFQGEAHQAFHLPAGPAAALLVHGFPGTPAELRPLGQALFEAGWTVRAPLLPGFGVAIAALPTYRAADWLAAVRTELAQLAAAHTPLLLVGFSMGGALAVQAAAEQPPDGLVLVAPFRQLGSDAQQLAWPLMRRKFPRFQPFAKADFTDPVVRRGLTDLLPGADLDDPAVQQALRELAVPAAVLDELRRVGADAWRAAPAVTAPALVVQGSADPVVRPAHTRALAGRLAGSTRYVEVDGGHDLLRPDAAGWPETVTAVLTFAHEVAGA